MNAYFSSDKKISSNFNDAINSGIDAYGWKDHACKHTPETKDIKLLIKNIFFHPQSPNFEWTL